MESPLKHVTDKVDMKWRVLDTIYHESERDRERERERERVFEKNAQYTKPLCMTFLNYE